MLFIALLFWSVSEMKMPATTDSRAITHMASRRTQNSVSRPYRVVGNYSLKKTLVPKTSFLH